MSASSIENRHMLPYTGHGMIEHYPRNMTLAGVVGHELRHKVSNEMKAMARGEVVRQKIGYNIAIVDGKVRATGGVTEATFYKKVEVEKTQDTAEMPTSTDDSSQNPIVSPPENQSTESVDGNDKIVELENEIRLLKTRLERLEGSDPPESDPATERKKALIQQEIQKLSTKIQMEKGVKALEVAQAAILGAIEKDSGFAAEITGVSAQSRYGTTALDHYSSDTFLKGSVIDTIL